MKLKDVLSPPVVAALAVLGASAFTAGGLAVVSDNSTNETPNVVVSNSTVHEQPFGFQILVDEPTPTPTPEPEPTATPTPEPNPTPTPSASNETVGGGGGGAHPLPSGNVHPSPSAPSPTPSRRYPR